MIPILSVIYLVNGLLDIVCNAGSDVSMQWFVLGRQRSSILVADLAFFHRPFAANDYVRTGLSEHQRYMELLMSIRINAGNETKIVNIVLSTPRRRQWH